jgi:hypothetical protein
LSDRFECRITERSLKDGFLNIPAEFVDSFPEARLSTAIRVFLDSATAAVKKNFQAKYKRITGLKRWYNETDARVGDMVTVEVVRRGEYRMRLVHSQVRLEKGRQIGRQWFESFRRELTTKWQNPRWGTDYGNDPWTKLMIQFLLDLGEKNGYTVKGEGGRRDVSWFRNGILEVHIEHENEGDDWDALLTHEITDLRNSSATLKVLITYVRPDLYPATNYAERLADLLNADEPKNSEWLLVVAPWYPKEAADYVGHYLRPSFARELLVIPSGLATSD